MQSRGRSLIKNTSILSFGTLCTKGIMFIMTPLFTRWLSKEDYGVFDLMSTYTSLVIPLITLVIGEAVFRFLLDETDESRKSSIISTAVITETLGLSVACVAAIVYTVITGCDIKLVVSFMLYLAMEMAYQFLLMSLRGEKLLNYYTIGNISFVVAMAVFVSLFVLVLGWGLPGILLGYACGNFVAVTLMVALSKEYKRIRFGMASKQELLRMLAYAIPMLPNAISWWIVNASDRTIIALVLGSGMNAVYAVANKIPALCMTFFHMFHLSWQQSATEAMSDKDRDQYYNQVMNNMICVVASICFVILAVNGWFFKLLFTEEYQPGAYQSPILVIAIVFSILGQFVGGIYVAQKKSKRNGVTTLIAAVINLIVNAALITSIGLYAASISTLVAYASLFVIRFIDIRKEIKLAFKRKSLLALALMCYFLACCYIRSDILQYANAFAAVIAFCFMNAQYAQKLMRLVKRRAR